MPKFGKTFTIHSGVLPHTAGAPDCASCVDGYPQPCRCDGKVHGAQEGRRLRLHCDKCGGDESTLLPLAKPAAPPDPPPTETLLKPLPDRRRIDPNIPQGVVRDETIYKLEQRIAQLTAEQGEDRPPAKAEVTPNPDARQVSSRFQLGVLRRLDRIGEQLTSLQDFAAGCLNRIEGTLNKAVTGNALALASPPQCPTCATQLPPAARNPCHGTYYCTRCEKWTEPA